MSAGTGFVTGTPRSLREVGAMAPMEQLRLALRLDALATALVGVATAAGALVLDDVVGIMASVLVGIGAFLVAYSVAVWLVAARPLINRLATWAVIGLNAAWAIGTVVAAVAAELTAIGVAVTVVQALAVAAFAELQLTAVRRCTRQN